MSQDIRRSQFILTLGPGSIMEGKYGSRLIPLPNIGLINGIKPVDFEISDRKISEGLLGGTRLFSIPSNSELNLNDRPIYKTRLFPEWAVCNKHKILYYRRKGCPDCKSKTEKGAIRFVLACPKGHMDDLPWNWLVHSSKKSRNDCFPNWFKWIPGRGIRDTQIKCPKCDAKISMGTVYSMNLHCGGRYIERESLGYKSKQKGETECDETAKVTLRQASYLRIPEIVSLFTTIKYTKLHKLLETKILLTELSLHPPEGIEELRKSLDNMVNKGFLGVDVAQEISNHSWGEIENAIADIMGPVPKDYQELIAEEFNTFLRASSAGIPPVSRKPPSSPVLLKVDPNKVTTFETGDKSFRVVPIERLHTTIIQKGYRRLVGEISKSKVVDISFSDENGKWLPAVEFFGEGIFIMPDNDEGFNFKMQGKNTSRWEKSYISPAGYDETLFKYGYGSELHPVFVWWHTMAHLLIRYLSTDSGYSAASIRERIYFENTEEGPRGGILLYTVQPGTDGTLGGLVSLAPKVEELFKKLGKIAKSCSNDPICIQRTFDHNKHSGSACYGCLLVSETSCEHRNMWLDRHVVLENMP